MRRSQYHHRTAIAAIVLGLASAWVQAKDPVRPVSDLHGSWQLFIDDNAISLKSGLARQYHPLERYAGNPVMVDDTPWEELAVCVGKVLPGEDGTGFRMWYYAWGSPEKDSRTFACYATSKDGIRWEKPTLGQVARKDGSKENNRINGGSCVMYTPWESDPELRYKSPGSSMGYTMTTSADGIRWKALTDKPVIHGGDVANFIWDPITRDYMATIKVIDNVTGLRRRCVGYSRTSDVKEWPKLRLIMAPDDIDDRWAQPGSIQRTHFYGCPIFPYQTAYLGLLWIYRANDNEGYFHGPLWAELVSSRDGQHWRREEGDRPPLLGLGNPGSFDDGMVIPTTALRVNDRIWVYYTGYDDGHDILPYRTAIGLATIRNDGWVSMDAGRKPGELLTKRLKGAAGPLHVNFAAPYGSLKIEVLTGEGKVVPGFSRDDCDALTGDSIDKVVTWKGKVELPKSESIRLRFLMTDVALYSFLAGEAVSVVDDNRQILEALYTFEDADGGAMADRLAGDDRQRLNVMGTSKANNDAEKAAFGKQSLTVGSQWQPLNRVEIEGTRLLGAHFTLAAMVRSERKNLARLFSAYRGNNPVNCSELVFDFDPSGKVISGLRLFCKGIPVCSDPLKFDDGKYHHLAVVFNDGEVRFYLDGKRVGTQWLPGGDPVVLSRNLMIGEDLEPGNDEQLHGTVDDVLVLCRAMSDEEITSLAGSGAEVFFSRSADRP